MSINAIETQQFNCTTCPSECLLTVEVERNADGAVVEVRSVTGNSCPRGDTFAHQELTCCLLYTSGRGRQAPLPRRHGSVPERFLPEPRGGDPGTRAGLRAQRGAVGRCRILAGRGAAEGGALG